MSSISAAQRTVYRYAAVDTPVVEALTVVLVTAADLGGIRIRAGDSKPDPVAMQCWMALTGIAICCEGDPG